MKRKVLFNSGSRPVIKLISSILALLVLISILICNSYSDEFNKNLSDDIIRLHVIANSDTTEDQALKRSVRDVVLKYMKDNLKLDSSLKDAKDILNKDMDKITAIAKEEVLRWGKNYPVKSMLGNFPFPTKTYGDIALPAGNYQALRIVIGTGEGANWWCVLFPPLCFVDATHGTVPDDVKVKLKNCMSEEEYEVITSTNNDDIPVKVKFKVMDFVNGSKVKISSFFNKVFKK
ncbi:stage II sporulation protein R [Pseudobacteroides cellulosolvens]|uniref:Stage II sporulation protein R n=1 Tax=Pseudobacteroides cellulosolvens ATCC 35603 = DSM 2933 TaxID=398512 RepID=A0A0L6JXS2_9FIRM|nr:stage II sporulation protein R [Pseudobacteroides cellulosolvens]KNY30360.1 stage II sporulation protein R [Pseudobacteroides cellulosolvens ATCC 35603 = DSM 2933]